MTNNNNNKQLFPMNVVLSAVSGTLLCDFSDVHKFYDFMTGDQLLTHQLPRAAEECEASLKRQFPDLAKVEVPEGLDTEVKVWDFLSDYTPIFGTTLWVEPLAPEEHTHINPILELLNMMENHER